MVDHASAPTSAPGGWPSPTDSPAPRSARAEPRRRAGTVPVQRAQASAPMRVSFAGGGTAVPPFAAGIGGRVVGTALDLRVRVRVEPFDRGWVRIDAPSLEQSVTRRRDEPASRQVAFRLMEAAIARTGVDDGVRLEVDTVVLPGAGLGGSASAAVAALYALYASTGRAAAPAELAREAVSIEREGLGLACGSQDQAFAALGGTLDLRYDDRGRSACWRVAVPPALMRELGAGLLLVDTRTRRVSGDVLGRIDAATRAVSDPELVAAAGDVARGLAEGSLARTLSGMRRSAAAKLRRDPAGNAFALDLAHAIEGLGAEVVRACGAGAGGHVLVWAPPERHAAITAAVSPSVVRHPVLDAPGARLELA